MYLFVNLVFICFVTDPLFQVIRIERNQCIILRKDGALLNWTGNIDAFYTVIYIIDFIYSITSHCDTSRLIMYIIFTFFSFLMIFNSIRFEKFLVICCFSSNLIIRIGFYDVIDLKFNFYLFLTFSFLV